MLSLLLTAALLPAALPAPAAMPPADSVGVDSTISEVVVYGGSARVTRSATLPGSGSFTLAGLPSGVDKETVRVRLADGNVVAVELRDRMQSAVPDERVQVLRNRIEALVASEREAGDERQLLLVSREHLETMLRQEGSAHAGDVGAGRPNVDAWRASLSYLTTEMRRVSKDLRITDALLEQIRTDLHDARYELGQADTGRVHLVDMVLDVVARGPTRLDVEYQMRNAGWRPTYDLRTSGDASSVELVYRAEVWQQTGEDWGDVNLALSTAQPQRGAQGPDPRAIRLGLRDPQSFARRAASAPASRALDESDVDRLEALGYLGDDVMEEPELAAFAGVVSQGLSVQFRLPRKETIESRDQPTTVLVGQQVLEVEPEHYTTPALDETVWLRGLTENRTPWTLLPGSAAVHFGADYIGKAHFGEPVLPEQEFTLHLGADPGLVAEREMIEDLHEEPGFLSDRQGRKQAWRIKLTNTGGHPAGADGSVTVIVREAIPLTSDDRLSIEVVSESVKPSKAERWKQELEEQGIHTWLVTVPRGGEAEVSWRLRTTWPEGTTISGGVVR
jgi:uncharacterized protein (TIGR02231 family)